MNVHQLGGPLRLLLHLPAPLALAVVRYLDLGPAGFALSQRTLAGSFPTKANELRRAQICPLADKSCSVPVLQSPAKPVRASHFKFGMSPAALCCDGTEAYPCGR